MARVVVTAPADADVAAILTELANQAGYATAARYDALLERLYRRLADHPESGPARHRLGRHIRVGVVAPYLVIYRHVKGEDTVNILRVLHGRRRITRQSIAGKS